MSSTDLHRLVFKWPHTEPTTVVVTGTFDKWSSSIHLVKNSTGFEGEIGIPWEQKIKFKYIVDGEWLLHEDQPTEVDPGGYVNNIYTAPAKPASLPAPETTPLPVEVDKPTTAEANNHTTNGNIVTEVAEKFESLPPKDTTKSLMGTTDGKLTGVEPKISNTQTSGFPQIAEESSPDLPPSPMAPLVPIVIVPVNAAENNTVVSSPPPESVHIIPRFTPESTMLVESKAAEEKANGTTPDPAIVNTPHVPEHVGEEITIADEIPSEPIIEKGASEAMELPITEDHPVLSETTMTPATAAVVGTEPIILPTEPNLVTEENAQTPISVPEIKHIQTPAASSSLTERTATVATEEVAKPIATPQTTEDGVPTNGHFKLALPTTPRRESSTTGSVAGIQGFPLSLVDSPTHTANSSPTSSKFNSARKKRTSIFGKIKHIFHHDKEKEKK